MIDAHLHVWKADPTFPDPAATTVSSASDAPVELLEQYMEEFAVERAVIVQPLYPGEDNSYVTEVTQAQPEKFAAVVVVDPRRPEAANSLERWVKDSGAKGLRLRPGVPDESACYGHESTFPLWERIQQLGVVVNVLGGFAFMEQTRLLADRFGDVNIILDHMAHPDIAGGANSWQPLLDLASCPNVHVKVSGYPYCSKQSYPFLDCRDLVKAIYDRFGPKRMIWGSDFPHILLQTGYQRAILGLSRLDLGFTDDELQTIQHDNALRLYW